MNGHVGEGGDVKLFQVHGRSAMTAMTVEVEAKAASLNSNDCFVLVSSGRTKETLVWLVRILTVYVLMRFLSFKIKCTKYLLMKLNFSLIPF